MKTTFVFVCFFSLCHSQTPFECFRSLKRSVWLLFACFDRLYFYSIFRIHYSHFSKRTIKMRLTHRDLFLGIVLVFSLSFFFLTCHCRDISVISSIQTFPRFLSTWPFCLWEVHVGFCELDRFVFYPMILSVPSGPPRKVEVEAVNSSSVKVLWRSPVPSRQHGQIRGYQVHYVMMVNGEPVGHPVIRDILIDDAEVTFHHLVQPASRLVFKGNTSFRV